MSRIRDGGLEDAPIWDDVKTFDGARWEGVDIVSGGFPCQDVSNAGKREGISKKTRSGLFYELARICREVEPRFILLENVAGLLVYPGAHRIFGELAEMGFDAGWKIISASDVGAPHQRERIWIVANSISGRRRKKRKPRSMDGMGERRQDDAMPSKKSDMEMADSKGKRKRPGLCKDGQGRKRRGRSGYGSGPKREESAKKMADSNKQHDDMGRSRTSEIRRERSQATKIRQSEISDAAGQGRRSSGRNESETPTRRQETGQSPSGDWWRSEPDVGRVAHGVAARVDRLRCCGNGVVPQQALPAWEEILRLADEN